MSPQLRERETLGTRVGHFELRFAEGDAQSAQQVMIALEAAAPRLARWGQLREPVVIRMLPSHDALEEAVNREGYDWLRAWARYDQVFLQSPRTWSLFGATQSAVDELLLHELTHCVMYQAAASREDWKRKEIPLWFREGMASVTAAQSYRWPGLEALARYYADHPGKDPAGRPEELYQRESDIVYGAAHHAFAFLSQRYGDERIREILRQMRIGQKFPGAFERVMRITPETFLREFERYLRLRGFRGRRLQQVPPRLAPPPPPAPAPAPVPPVLPPAPPGASRR